MHAWGPVPPVIVALLLIQAGFRSKIGTLLAKSVLSGTDYLVFLTEWRTWILFLGMLLMILAIASPSGARSRSAQAAHGITSARPWFTAFLLFTCMSVAAILYANPEGRLPWNRRESYITIVGRTMKPYQYEQLRQTPDLVVMGSSVSYAIAASQLQEQ